MNNKAFSLAEVLIALIVVGVLTSCVICVIKPNVSKDDIIKKSGLNMLFQINLATKQIMAKYSTNYQMTKLLTPNGVSFNITSNNADIKLASIFKKVLIQTRNSSVPEEYLNTILVNEQNEVIDGNVKISDFTQGFKLKNGTYMAFLLHGNCTTSETYLYDPSLPDKRTIDNSCGLIFYDVNSQEGPNVLGIDEYIIAIGKYGIK